MKRTAINPWPWSLAFGFNQAELVEEASKVLVCSGQTAVDADGAPKHAGDMAAQISLALDNLEAVLRDAGMGLGNLVRLNFYTTDVDAFIANAGVFGARLGAAGVTPPGTLLGVARLAFPELMIEIEATAVG
ncbi:MAG TPA: RidA family protein [Acidimicrobiales bacterium]|nr:RidA family protein [Acidimicrobiales bacterium]